MLADRSPAQSGKPRAGEEFRLTYLDRVWSRAVDAKPPLSRQIVSAA
jgi:hypothetical protein